MRVAEKAELDYLNNELNEVKISCKQSLVQ